MGSSGSTKTVKVSPVSGSDRWGGDGRGVGVVPEMEREDVESASSSTGGSFLPAGGAADGLMPPTVLTDIDQDILYSVVMRYPGAC